MHRFLHRQLRKLGLDADKPPQDLNEWYALIERIDMAYQQNDDGLYTLELSGEIADREMRELNEQFLQAKELAEQSNKYKSQFLAMMSHEIRTPMHGVLGMTELLLGTPLNEQQEHYARTVMQSVTSLLRIINDVLDFSKIEANKLELEIKEFSLPELMRQLKDMFNEQSQRKQLSFSIDTPDDLPPLLYGDSVRLWQIMNNLLNNAFKFTNTGSIEVIVTIKTRLPESIELMFEVIDSGIGMDPETCSHVFESFSQADESTTRMYGGTGLGLAIVKRLIDIMHGEIGIDSEPQVGTRFWFRLPFDLVLVENAANAQALHTTDELPFVSCDQSRHILLAEDQPINQELAMLMLESLGHQVDIVSNGVEAIQAMSEHQYDMVFMDCQMPEMDGLEATRRIRVLERERDEFRPIRIVALTANALPADIEKCKDAGMDEFISKPFSINDLKKVI